MGYFKDLHCRAYDALGTIGEARESGISHNQMMAILENEDRAKLGLPPRTPRAKFQVGDKVAYQHPFRSEVVWHGTIVEVTDEIRKYGRIYYMEMPHSVIKGRTDRHQMFESDLRLVEKAVA
jgi:hypothetical protein